MIARDTGQIERSGFRSWHRMASPSDAHEGTRAFGKNNAPLSARLFSRAHSREKNSIHVTCRVAVVSRWLIVFAVIILLTAPQFLHAHAGHDAIPEAATQAVGDVAPRFYAVSDAYDAVLTFPKAGETGDPVLYLSTSEKNAPVTGAEIRAEVLLPDVRILDTTTGPEAGTYVLQGLEAETTHTLSVEVMAGDTMDILSFDNVIVEENADDYADQMAAASLAFETIFGLPPYLFYALVAVVGILAVANLLVVIIWIVRLIRGRKKSKTNSGSDLPNRAALLLLLLPVLTSVAYPHAGEDHSGGSLAASATNTSGSAHFVAIETQFQADVRTTLAVETVLPKSLKALGQVTVRPDFEADVTAPAEGKLKPPPGSERILISGATVNKGDVLAVLEQLIPATDKVTLTNEKSQVEAELGQAREEMALATTNAARAESLSKIIATQEVEQARANLKIAQDKVRGLTQRLATLTNSLSGVGPSVRDIPIVSPITGAIVESHATIGEYVSPEKILFDIVNLDEVFVEANIFESDISLIREATTARITLEAFPNMSFDGTLHSMGQQVNPERRTLLARFNVMNFEHLLRGGMFANVDIYTTGSTPVLLVPKDALYYQDGIRQVFIKTTPETYVATPITVVGYRDDMAVIGQGLAAGDRVAVSGMYQIRMSPVIGAGN